ncbi:MAG: 16S rRNA (guanine(966)-N(2))-methyltransferase RsmD, partial [Verrucomicrobiota bacterium]
MRVIAGSAGRLPLQVPKSIVRPSTDRLREALFSILMGRLEGARVLDLFAGSGALGIEALSRGAARAVFVDSKKEAIETIRKNLERTRLEEKGLCRRGEVFQFLKEPLESPFDLILADPPYQKQAHEVDLGHQLLVGSPLAEWLAPDGLLVLERFQSEPPAETGPWELTDVR